MTKLTDTQSILLSIAAQRDTLSILPLPETLKPQGATKAIDALLKRGLIEERETSEAAAVHRTDGDIRFGLFTTSAGLAAIGVEGAKETATDAPTTALPRATKTRTILSLLQREAGATFAELISATGWLPHTTRAALTGLRKKGHAVERGKRGEETCYRVIAA